MFKDWPNSNSYTSGIAIGGVIEVVLNKNFILTLEPMYVQKRTHHQAKYSWYAYEGTSERVYKSSFLETPLAIKAMFDKSPTIYLVAGPSIGFLLDSEMELKQAIEDISGDLNVDLMEVSRKIDLGLGCGGGVRFSFHQLSIFLEARWTYHFVNMVEHGTIVIDSLDYVDVFPYKNAGIRIMLGVTVALGDR